MSDRSPSEDPLDRFLGELGARAVPADLASVVVGRVRAGHQPRGRRLLMPQALVAAVLVVAVGVVGVVGFQAATLEQPSNPPTELSPEPSASSAPETFEFARIVAEGVEIRTEPGGGEVITSTAGDLGDLVLVLARRPVGPTEWVRVEHWSPRGSARFGWMPQVADLDTPRGVQRLETLEPATPPCESLLTTDLPSLSTQPPPVRLACLGSREIRLSPAIGRNEGSDEPTSGEPAWLAMLNGLKLYGQRGWDSNDSALDVHVNPASGISLPMESWVEVMGHFDDPAATTCERTSAIPSVPVGDPAEQVLWCRQQFVVTSVLAVAPPEPAPSPTPVPIIAGRWEAIADAPIQGRTGHTAIWTGTEMIVWGGTPGPATTDDVRTSDGSEGAAYHPATDRWRVVGPPPISGRTGHVTTWTGREMLVWGGREPFGDGRLNDGAAYDPAADTWRVLPSAPLSGSGGMAATWTGRQWIVIDGITDIGGPISARVAAYDPEANTWDALPDLEMPASWSVLASWTGQDLIVVANPNQGRSAAFALHPNEDWIGLPEPPFDGLNTGNAGVWTGSELLVTTTQMRVAGEDRIWDQVFAYDPTFARWRTAALPPAGLRTLQPAWTGTTALFFSGAMPADMYDPTRDRWFSLPPTGDRTREFAQGIWAGDRFITWGGGEGESFLLKPDGVAFIPDVRYVEAPGPEGRLAVRVEIADSSGGLLEARAATEEELTRDPGIFTASDVDVAQGDDSRSLLIRWVGGPGDKAARLEIAGDRATMDLAAVPTYGDAIPVWRGIVITFGDPVDAAGVRIQLWSHRR